MRRAGKVAINVVKISLKDLALLINLKILKILTDLIIDVWVPNFIFATKLTKLVVKVDITMTKSKTFQASLK